MCTVSLCSLHVYLVFSACVCCCLYLPFDSFDIVLFPREGLPVVLGWRSLRPTAAVMLSRWLVPPASVSFDEPLLLDVVKLDVPGLSLSFLSGFRGVLLSRVRKHFHPKTVSSNSSTFIQIVRTNCAGDIEQKNFVLHKNSSLGFRGLVLGGPFLDETVFDETVFGMKVFWMKMFIQFGCKCT